MIDEEIKPDAASIILGVMLMGVVILFCIAASTCMSGNDELYKTIAKEYDIPLSQVEEIVDNKIDSDFKMFPLPHDIWYVTTERAEDVEVASGYFGNISLDKDALDQYFRFGRYQEVYRDIPQW